MGIFHFYFICNQKFYLWLSPSFRDTKGSFETVRWSFVMCDKRDAVCTFARLTAALQQPNDNLQSAMIMLHCLDRHHNLKLSRRNVVCGQFLHFYLVLIIGLVKYSVKWIPRLSRTQNYCMQCCRVLQTTRQTFKSSDKNTHPLLANKLK